jgi:hypothetical protein
MLNPQQYAGRPENFVTADGTPLNHAPAFALDSQGRIVEASGDMYDSRGNLNAYHHRDHDARTAALAKQRLRGRIRRQKRSAMMTPEQREGFVRICKEAAADKTDRSITLVGEVVSDVVYEVMNREGLSRNLLAKQQVAQGDTARIKVYKKDIMAFLSLGGAAVAEQEIEQDYIYPALGTVSCLVTMDELQLALASPDILDKKYEDMLEAFGVREDRMLKFTFDLAAPAFNNLTSFVTFTPATMTTLMNQVGGWGLPTATMLMSYDILADMRSDPDWTAWFDPGTKHQLALEGYLESLMGVEIVVDGFRYENLKVLNQGEVYMLTTPTALGVFSQVDKLQTKAIDKYPFGQMKRGWAGFEIIAHTVPGGRGIAKATRST